MSLLTYEESRQTIGDSYGLWEGDTLVVETVSVTEDIASFLLIIYFKLNDHLTIT